MRRALFATIIATVPAHASAKGQSYVAVGVAMPDFSYDLERQPTTRDDSEAVLTYEPNIPLAATVDVGYRGVAFGTSFDLEKDEPDPVATDGAAKVESSFQSYDLSYYYDRIGVDLAYVELTGMNVTSATGYADYLAQNERDAHRPDIELTSQSLNLWTLPLASNLSLKNFFDTASPATGSGLGLLVLASYDQLDEKTKRELIPEKFNRGYGTDAGFMGGHFQSAALSLGPMFVLEKGGFYVSGLAALGRGKQWATYRTADDGEQESERVSDKMRAALDLGFKGKTMFSTASYSLDSPTYHLNSITISTTRGLLSWVIGVRL